MQRECCDVSDVQFIITLTIEEHDVNTTANHNDDNNNNPICKAAECRKTSVALIERFIYLCIYCLTLL